MNIGKKVCHKNTAYTEKEVFCWKCKIKNRLVIMVNMKISKISIHNIKSLFIRGSKVKPGAALFTCGNNTWGNSISWGLSSDDILADEIGESQRFHGWKNIKPSIGDYIQVPMTSGNNCLFKITQHEHLRDPPDMFFCTGIFIGYSEDNHTIIQQISDCVK